LNFAVYGGFEMEAIAPTVIEINPQMSVDDLYLALKLTCPNAPSRSQFYEWLKLTWCNDASRRGGKRSRQVYEQHHLNRLTSFARLRDTFASLAMAQKSLFEEMKRNPELYFEEQTDV
jgi:hypothetical protein